ncbi:MAG: hypothetical protein K5745_08610 [Saccharofermentans sp.]|nr:hypothetical protein [Saccharofermentans sp.]
MADIIGQNRLKSLIASEASFRHSSSYLLNAPKGMGKHLLANAFAKALMCEAPKEGKACCECKCCKYFDAGTTPDIVRIEAPEDGKNIKVEEIRNRVVADASIKPQFSKLKVFIIDLDCVAEDGQNVLLKSIEEPPENVVFILLSSVTDRVLSTVMSRVMELKIDPYTSDEIYEILKANEVEGTRQELEEVLAYCAGNPGRALSIASDEEFGKLTSDVTDLILSIGDHSYSDILTDDVAFMVSNKDRFALISEIILKTLDSMAMYLKAPDNKTALKASGKIKEFVLSNKRLNTVRIGRCVEAVNSMKKALMVNCNYENNSGVMLLAMHEELRSR